ncbi:transposase, partial [Bacillus shackletonii]|nr:transposase [Heyndrickxia shackletonii]
MAKYSEEFKKRLVTEYLEGNIGYGSLAKKYNMGSQTSIREWV